MSGRFRFIEKQLRFKIEKEIEMKSLFVLSMLVGVGISQGSFAQETYKTKTVYVDQATGFRFKAKEKGTISLDGWKHVEKLKIKVSGEVPGFRFWANGREFSPVFNPGAEPYYSVNVGAAISGFEVRADQDCALSGVIADEIDHEIHAPCGGYGGYSAEAGDELATIQRDVYTLRYMFEDEKFITYLRPILDAIAQAEIMEYSRGEIAQQSLDAMDAVIAQVDFASHFLMHALKIDADREIAIELLSAKESLSMLRGR